MEHFTPSTTAGSAAWATHLSLRPSLRSSLWSSLRSAQRWAAIFLASALWAIAWAGTVSAQTPVKLKITIRSVLSQDCMDIVPCDGASFYSNVMFDGAIHSNIRQTSQWYGRDQIMPDWSFVWDTHSHDTVDVDVEIWDEDGFLRGADDQLDLDPAPGQTVDARRFSFRVDIQECINDTQFALTGEASGRCGSITSTGLEPGIRGTINLDVEVETPPHAPGLRVRCLHEPIWPQPGDTVTVTAEALDDTPVGKNPIQQANIEVWMNGGNSPALNCTSTTCSFQQPNVQGTSLSYGCKVEKNGNEAWSGWRTTQVGNANNARAIPVVLTGSPSSRIDVVFVAAQQTCTGGTCVNYTSALDPTFLNRVHQAIEGSFYDWDIHLRNQDGLNFWIATDMGHTAPGFVLNAPADWGSVYSFSDVGAVLHENFFRDSAQPWNRIFSTEPTSFGTIMHEAGHSPFGLVDEYCCDAPYHEPAALPNVYSSEASCQADVPNLQHLDPNRTVASCREISRTRPDGSVQRVGAWVSDPAANDMMAGSGNRAPNASDTRRIEWIYGMCKEASCLDVRP